MNDPPFWLTDEQSARLWAHLPTDTRGKARVAAMSDHVVEWVDMPPENLDYAGEQQMVTAQRDAMIAVLPDIQVLARQIILANDPNPTNRAPLSPFPSC